MIAEYTGIESATPGKTAGLGLHDGSDLPKELRDLSQLEPEEPPKRGRVLHARRRESDGDESGKPYLIFFNQNQEASSRASEVGPTTIT